ncbi:MAG: ABC transporter ATP-binding protein [Streptococcus minor]|nr:ABC transporter ATP-binding protein [Streptococcus minor]
MLRIRNLSKKFGQKPVLDNLTVDIKEYGVHLIVGMNGCGKTTFMNSLSSLLKVEAGTIDCFGQTVGTKAFKKFIYYIPSDFYLPEYLTGQEYLEMMLNHYPSADFSKLDILFSIFDLESHRYKLLETYSFGMKKKIQLIAAISAGTSYVIADELFSGLDFDTVLLVEKLLKCLHDRRSFVIVTHDLNTLRAFPDHIYIMSNGRLERYKDKIDHINSHVKNTGGINGKLREIQEYFVSNRTVS